MALAWIFPCDPDMGDEPTGEAFTNALTASALGCGPIVQRVRCATPLKDGECQAGKVLFQYNATPVLRRFAREVALGVVHHWDPPPVVTRWLRTGDESIRDVVNNAAYEAAEAMRGPGRAAAQSAGASADDDAVTAIFYAADKAATAASGTVYFRTPRRRGRAAITRAARAAADKKQANRLATLLTAGRKTYGQRFLP